MRPVQQPASIPRFTSICVKCTQGAINEASKDDTPLLSQHLIALSPSTPRLAAHLRRLLLILGCPGRRPQQAHQVCGRTDKLPITCSAPAPTLRTSAVTIAQRVAARVIGPVVANLPRINACASHAPKDRSATCPAARRARARWRSPSLPRSRGSQRCSTGCCT